MSRHFIALIVVLVSVLQLAVLHDPAIASGERVLTYQVPFSYVDQSPAIGDLTGAGKRDIVINVMCGTIIALDASFNELWRWDDRTSDENTLPPTIADLNGDGKMEVLSMMMSGRLVCLEGKTGRLLWSAKLPSAVNLGTAVVVAADLAGDGRREVLATDSKDTMTCFNGKGALLWRFTDKAGLNTIPAVGDLYGDGKTEVVTGAPGAPVICLSGRGKELWRVRRAGPVGRSHVIVDLNGDGKREILACVGHEVQAYTNTGKLLWSRAMKGELNAGLAAADADGSGRPQVYVTDERGDIARIDADGALRWTVDGKERIHRGPTIADVDGDGRQEILAAGYSGYLYVLDPQGRQKELLPTGGGANAAPTVADLAGDGRLSVILPISTAGSLIVFRWNSTTPHPVTLWPEYRCNSARTSCAPAVPAGPAVAIAAFTCGDRSVGDSVFAVRVANPRRKRLQLTLSVRSGASLVARLTDESAYPTFGGRLHYRLNGAETAAYTYECDVREGQTVVASRTRNVVIAPFAREVGELTEAADRLQTALPKLPNPAELEPEAADVQVHAAALRARVASAGSMAGPDRERLRGDLEAQRDRAQRVLAMAEAITRSGGNTLLAVPANPWAPFGGAQELAEGRCHVGPWQVGGFYGERVSAAGNLFNLSGRPLTVRVEVASVTSAARGQAASAKGVVTVREAVESLTQFKDTASDALPKLNEAHTIVIPPWEARQLWLTISTAALKPGAWTVRVSLRPSTYSVKAVAPELTVNIWNTALPKAQAARLCGWAGQGPFDATQSDALLQDELEHGMNVFTTTPAPTAKFDANGDLVGPVDYAAHDAYVRPRVGRGIFLVGGSESCLSGPAPYASALWNRANALFLRAWVAHLHDLGVGYEDFALYPMDEPGLVEGRVDDLIGYAKIVHDADPRIRFYADPVAGASLDDLKRMAPYIDIWTPSRNGYLLHEGANKLAFLKSTGKTVWTYECQDAGRHRSVLGYYRCLAWIAWFRGLTGFGFWTYNSGPSSWDGQDDYSLVYPGDGVIPSKRWEAVGEGVQDFSMLAAFRAATDRVGGTGRHPEAVKEARALLDEGAREIAWFCDMDEFGTLVDVDGFASLRRVEDTRWEKLQAFRREMARLFDAFGE